MPQIEVKLPSGARGRVRGLKGEEINLFANRQSSRRGQTAMQILKNVWIETIDPGPLYGKDGAGQIDWDKAPSCDRFTALFYARIATYGSEYTFRHQCEECRKRFEWALDLKDDLTVKDLPEDSIFKFQNGNKFTTEVMDSEGNYRKIVFQLVTPKLEEKVDQVQNLAPKEKATASLAQRIVSIEGIEDGKGPLKRFLNEMEAGPMLDLVEAMDEADGGIETRIEIECPHCGHIMELDLPLREEFWSPSRRKRSTSS